MNTEIIKPIDIERKNKKIKFIYIIIFLLWLNGNLEFILSLDKSSYITTLERILITHNITYVHEVSPYYLLITITKILCQFCMVTVIMLKFMNKC